MKEGKAPGRLGLWRNHGSAQNAVAACCALRLLGLTRSGHSHAGDPAPPLLSLCSLDEVEKGQHPRCFQAFAPDKCVIDDGRPCTPRVPGTAPLDFRKHGVVMTQQPALELPAILWSALRQDPSYGQRRQTLGCRLLIGVEQALSAQWRQQVLSIRREVALVSPPLIHRIGGGSTERASWRTCSWLS